MIVLSHKTYWSYQGCNLIYTYFNIATIDRMSVLYLNDLYDLQKLHEDENLSQTYILIPGN